MIAEDIGKSVPCDRKRDESCSLSVGLPAALLFEASGCCVRQHHACSEGLQLIFVNAPLESSFPCLLSGRSLSTCVCLCLSASVCLCLPLSALPCLALPCLALPCLALPCLPLLNSPDLISPRAITLYAVKARNLADSNISP